MLVVVGLRDIADGFVQDDGESSLLLKLSTRGERNGLAIDATARVHDLSMGERQRVEILRGLLAAPVK